LAKAVLVDVAEKTILEEIIRKRLLQLQLHLQHQQ
jgi:hypothetical protein